MIMRKNYLINILLVAFLALLISACSTNSPLSCEEVNTEALGIDGLTIISSESIAADSDFALSHCKVLGTTGEHTGIDNQEYAINFELRLPNVWNEKFVHQFNGGTNGSVSTATGSSPARESSDNALNRGYSVVSSDAGHDGSADTNAGLAAGARFGLDPTARNDYGYTAVAKINPLSKEIIEKYYAKEIKYTYGIGGSNGGRHAMVASTRMAEAFDGFLVGYPGFNLPKAAVQHAHDIQQFESINGDVTNAFTDDELDLVSNKINEVCDSLDGLADGMINDLEQCQSTFDINVLLCASGQTTDCLSTEQVNALTKIHEGPKNSNGDSLYSSWAWDAGINSSSWKSWKYNSGIPPWDGKSIISVMGASSLAQVFTTPPTIVGGTADDLETFLLNFDFDTDAAKIYATNSEFTESAMDFMTPVDSDNPYMSDFKNAGGKMMILHGTADPVFSVVDTTNWYDKLNTNNNNDAQSFVKFYRIPGMPHGSGGVSTDNVDMLTALENWVENGMEPEELVATTTDTNTEIPTAQVGMTRLLCPYPKIATYTGTDSMSSDSFTCQ